MHKTTILCQFGLLSPAYLPVSPSILNHFWWELYQYGQLTEGEVLPAGYCLYGDNTYVNESNMAVLFQATSNGPIDSYNFYHSQVRINIECAFSILTNRWHLLKTLLIAKISIS